MHQRALWRGFARRPANQSTSSAAQRTAIGIMASVRVKFDI
jgi:hypothetical protein